MGTYRRRVSFKPRLEVSAQARCQIAVIGDVYRPQPQPARHRPQLAGQRRGRPSRFGSGLGDIRRAAQQAQLGALGPALAGKVLQRCEEP